jgi:hypothetical protein
LLWGVITEVTTHNTSHTRIKQMKYSKNLTLLQLEFRIDLQNFKWEIKNKRDLRKRSLDGQERNLTLGMPSLEWLTPEGEREHLQNINKVKAG